MTNIDFDAERWQRVIATNRKWWAGELERPLIQFVYEGRDPGRPEPDLPRHFFTAFYDRKVPAEAIVDRWDYDLSRYEFLGDAFPNVFPNFGPGVIAEFLGARMEIRSETVWFHPAEETPIAKLKFEYNPDSFWLNRIKAVCRAGVERWGGLVQIGMTDLGGNLDILSAFRPGEQLLLDLHDCPDEVKRVTWEAHEMWWRYFKEISDVIRQGSPGYSSWSGMFSSEPHYILQCDFAYMIGPRMFEEFVLPELTATCRRLTNSFYHLDGQGQLPHLDLLLETPELNGVQWVPGSGAPDCDQWPEVYKRIRDAGKLILVYGGVELLDTLASQLGDARGIQIIGRVRDRDQAIDCLRRYGAL